jgi:hypothetical protein
MIVFGSENVFAREVEDVVAHLAGVREVAVIGVDDERFGQQLRAFAVPTHYARLSAEDVREHVRWKLACGKVPRDVVLLARLPRTARGKVLRRELAAHATSPRPISPPLPTSRTDHPVAHPASSHALGSFVDRRLVASSFGHVADQHTPHCVLASRRRRTSKRARTHRTGPLT